MLRVTTVEGARAGRETEPGLDVGYGECEAREPHGRSEGSKRSGGDKIIGDLRQMDTVDGGTKRG